MIKEQEDYPLSTWIIDVMNITSQREFIEKKDALLLIVEDMVEFLEMYNEGLSPQAAYRKLMD